MAQPSFRIAVCYEGICTVYYCHSASVRNNTKDFKLLCSSGSMRTQKHKDREAPSIRKSTLYTSIITSAFLDTQDEVYGIARYSLKYFLLAYELCLQRLTNISIAKLDKPTLYSLLLHITFTMLIHVVVSPYTFDSCCYTSHAYFLSLVNLAARLSISAVTYCLKNRCYYNELYYWNYFGCQHSLYILRFEI